jgi:hypothetical protein
MEDTIVVQERVMPGGRGASGAFVGLGSGLRAASPRSTGRPSRSSKASESVAEPEPRRMSPSRGA